jgi:putative RecB family exonuclease
MRPLSYSQIALYQACPLCYKLQYIDGLETKDKGYFSFGTTMHKCAEYFFRVKVPPPPSLEELLQFYEQNWLSAGYQSAEEEENYRAYGREMLSKFWELHQPDFRMPIAVEWMFNIDVEGVKLRGFIDRIDMLESGGLAIVDYKTDRELFTNDYLARNLQLTLYQMAVEKSWFLPVERLTLYHFRSNTPCSCPPRGEAQLDEAKELVLAVAEGIEAGKFPATENEHCPCDFPQHCPYYRHRFAPAEEAAISGEAVGGAVERYVSLQSQIKELQLELEELKQKLADFCQAEGLSRVYGSDYALTYKLMERSGFNEDEVRALLEPVGLLGRVLSLDTAKLKELLSDDNIAQDIRDRLTALKQVISSSPRFWTRRLVEEE